MIVLALLETSQDRGLTATRRDARQRTRRPRREQNRAVRMPGAAPCVRRVGKDGDGLAVDVKALQFVVGEEPDGLAIRRPEGKRRAFGAWKRAARRRAQRPQPERRRVPNGRRREELLAIRRQRELREVRGHRGREGHIEPDFRQHRRLAQRYRGSCRRGCCDDGHRRPCDALTPAPARRVRRISWRSRRGRVLERDAHVGDVPPAPLGIFLQAPAQHLANVRRRVGGKRAPIGRSFEDGDNRVGNRVAREGRATGDHLEEHAAERPDVGALVDRVAAGLLGAHVRGRSDDPVVSNVARKHGWQMRQVASAVRVARGHRQPEIEHFDLAACREFEIGRLQIAMDDALAVCGVEGIGNLPGDRQRFIEGQASVGDASCAARELVGQRRPLDQLHDNRRRASGVLEAVNRGDVRMIQRCEQSRLAGKSRQPIRIAREGRWQYLDRDVPPELGVACAIHLPHAARSERTDNLERTEFRTDGEAHVATLRILTQRVLATRRLEL